MIRSGTFAPHKRRLWSRNVNSSRLTVCSLIRDGQEVLIASEAVSFIDRLRGLHALDVLNGNEALIIRPCRSIHTLGMRYAIDVAFLDRSGKIVKLARVVPGRMCREKTASIVVEMAAGAIEELSLSVGQTLSRENGTWM